MKEVLKTFLPRSSVICIYVLRKKTIVKEPLNLVPLICKERRTKYNNNQPKKPSFTPKLKSET